MDQVPITHPNQARPNTPRLCLISSLPSVHGFLDGHTESTLGIQGQAQDGYHGRDFLVAGKSGGDGQAEELQLHLENGASIEFTRRPATTAGQAAGAHFATDGAVQTAESVIQKSSYHKTSW